VANEIYMNSTRKNGPFIKVNCAAIPANLLEAELFGYAKGAFTGATSSGKLGMFELADKGTLLLDEIGEMPIELQSKLLRVIQHKELTHIGGTKPVKLDVRILAATNCNLKELCKQGRFREDLYYRLNVFPIYIPPLRVRVEDIEVLTQHFLDIYNSKYGKRNLIEPLGISMLKQYSWPGNIRELQNIIERLVIVSDQNATITKEQIGILLNINPSYLPNLVSDAMGLKDIVEILERQTIAKALELGGSTRKAAIILKIDQSTVVKKAKRLGLVINDEKTHQK
jgi:transcriptional regulator with PAS, ATPase and Fis domain